jgi:hypothetical protein
MSVCVDLDTLKRIVHNIESETRIDDNPSVYIERCTPRRAYRYGVSNEWRKTRREIIPSDRYIGRVSSDPRHYRKEFNPNADKPVCQGGPRWYR